MIVHPFPRKSVPVSPPLLLAIAHPGNEITEVNVKSRLLDAAERLIGDLGSAAVSVRAIASAAGVNPAAITYHFGSKNGLVEAVYTRRFAPIDRLRLEMLDRCEQPYEPGQLPLELVVEAFIIPLFKFGGCRPIVGRMYTESGSILPSPIAARLNEMETRFTSALSRALPDRNSTDVRWGMVFLEGMVAQTMLASGGTAAIARQMVNFACAGLRSLPSNRPGVAA